MSAGDSDDPQRLLQYVDVVYAAACRQMRNATAAADVTQAVFLVMTRKFQEGALPEEKQMVGWLLQVTHYAVKAAKRSAVRRNYHEKKAALGRIEGSEVVATPAENEELRATLDEALLQLGKIDREVVVRRYLHNEPIQAIATAVGLTENTAGRRIARAIEKLRKALLHRGVATPAAAVAAFMATEALVKAPPAVAGAVGSAAATTAANGVAKSVLGKMVVTKALAATTVSAAILVTGVALAAAVHLRARLASRVGVASFPVAAPASVSGTTQEMMKLPFTLSKETTVVTAPLHEDGTPDYVGAMNQRYGAGVTPENNGFVKWLEVVGTDARFLPTNRKAQILAMTGARETGGFGGDFGYFEYVGIVEGLTGQAQSKAAGEIVDAGHVLWTADQFPKVSAFLKTVDAPLDGVVEAANRPRWWSPYIGTSVVSVTLPSISVERNAGVALCARATLRMKGGDFAGFLADAMAVRRLARHAAGVSVLERMVATSIENRGCETLGAVVGSGVLTTAQVAAVKKANDALGPLPSIWESADGMERWANLEMAEFAAMGKAEALNSFFRNSTGKSGAEPWKTIETDAVDWDAVLKQLNGRVDEEVAALKMATFTEEKGASTVLDARILKSIENFKRRGETFSRDAGESREAYSARVADGIIAVMVPRFPAAEEASRHAVLEGEMLRVLVAAAEVKARKGDWPGKLEELGAAVAVPVDIYSPDEKEGVLYVHGKEGARIYSVGRNQMDDGGISDARMRADDFGVGVVVDVNGAVP